MFERELYHTLESINTYSCLTISLAYTLFFSGLTGYIQVQNIKFVGAFSVNKSSFVRAAKKRETVVMDNS